ncbi:hypothetical protein EV13_3102 [Prochlorococcus sp. MIT 0702]|nr:hypothetical protein EV12_3070 [Prochlorococcus sp. MIT 0701]KGG25271.1 hypothetical protein EV13_3102 [Prochlorococcus sp. MIT 0702]KGG33543.1 hypothetical protein EV14_1615 [Prochlorococcus sp. MIT 0703]
MHQPRQLLGIGWLEQQVKVISHPIPGTCLPIRYLDWRAVDRSQLWCQPDLLC